MAPASDTYEKNYDNVYESGHVTRAKFININYKWSIHNFQILVKELQKILESPTFPNVTCLIDSGFEGSLIINHTRMKVYASYVKNNVVAKCKVSILDSQNQEIKTAEFRMIMKQISQEYDAPASIGTAISNYSDDVLTILCEITIPTEIENIETKFAIPPCRLREDLCDLFKNQNLCDVTLCSGKQEIRAHKALLAAQSPVFNAMFENDTFELNKNRVEITDVDPEVLKEMPHFMYTGKVPNLEKIATNLLIAADKVICLEEISKKILTENVQEGFKLGRMHNDVQLTIECPMLHLKNISKQEAKSSNGLFYILLILLVYHIVIQVFSFVVWPLYLDYKYS